MKIGIMSDTHDRLDAVEKAVRVFQKQKVNLIIHCGDWVAPFVPQFIFSLEPKLDILIKSVFGNNEGDIFRFLNRQKTENWKIEFYKKTCNFITENKNIIVYHGDDKALTQGLINSQVYDLVLTGHTHKALIKKYHKTLHINPGAVSGYCEAKLINKQTIAMYDTNTNKGEIIDL